MNRQKIQQLCKAQFPFALALRNSFHENPELSFQEYQTSQRVADELSAMGLEVSYHPEQSRNVIAILRGKGGDGPTLLLRADMDALPIQELAKAPCCSKNSGVMHACAHDGHTAGLLGAAKVLCDLRDSFCGTIKLAFESGEENGGGAEWMIEQGVLENPKVDAAIGCHLFGTVKEGCAAFRVGPFMASCDTITVAIKGIGGHASTPHLTIDPVVIAAQFITTAQAAVARMVSPTDIGVVTFSTIHGGDFFNIIPNEVTITGSIRNFNSDTRSKLLVVLEGLLKGLCTAYGAEYSLTYTNSLPAVINDEGVTQRVLASVKKVIGESKAELLEHPQMGGETFSYFTHKVPSCFFFLGIDAGEQLPKGSNLHHNPLFQWRDENLGLYMECLVQAALDFLQTGK